MINNSLKSHFLFTINQTHKPNKSINISFYTLQCRVHNVRTYCYIINYYTYKLNEQLFEILIIHFISKY
jgi:hypothetical protein